ncbi:cAMP-dependent protein kinase catalytic subunit alpha isoform X1 [Hydra vulgaris]|uniref:cAMP-dependent protein kinase catalytic subunit alpha isoform X1 n=1 Tax=Hydra vulgaris TaxID=6087 RepID=UPI001F5E3C15|nr:cAMP-dependent protein kinase catalytic subunit alpha isoform X1 [Hydra vulgaris]
MFFNWKLLFNCLIQLYNTYQINTIRTKDSLICKNDQNSSVSRYQFSTLQKKEALFFTSNTAGGSGSEYSGGGSNPLDYNWPAEWDQEFVKNSFNVSAAMTYGEFNEIYSIVKYLDGGTYGRIYIAVKKSDASNQEFVVKFLKKSAINYDSALKEGLILLTLDHPNIVKCLDLFDNNEYVQMVMKSSGTRTMGFHIYLNNLPFFSENVARFFMKQISLAVKYLHDINRAHLDIKDTNVVINDQLELQLIDFGFSEDLNSVKEPINGMVGTDHFIAPEVYLRKFYGKSVDIWALGITLYLMYYGRFPFDYDFDVQKTIIPLTGFQPIRESSEDLLHLLHWMLNVDNEKRATIDDVINHKWFSGSYEFERYLFETPFSVDINELNHYFRVSYRSQNSFTRKMIKNLSIEN